MCSFEQRERYFQPFLFECVFRNLFAGTSIPVRGVGLVSFLAPCVLPLVPGYLSAVSSVEADRLGERGSAGRIVLSSLPFVAGLVSIFVLLGAGAAAIGLSIAENQFLLEQIAGFVLIVFGLVFMGALLWAAQGSPRHAVVGAATCTALVVQSFTDHLLDFPIVVLAAGLVLGWAGATGGSEELDVPEGQGPGLR